MADSATSRLRELVRRHTEFGEDRGGKKLVLLQALEKEHLSRAPEVLKLHEVLCFLRAYPDSPTLLRQVERMLASFDRRSDLRRHRAALADSGIAGTVIHYPFFWPTARWLASRWADRLEIDWPVYKDHERLTERLHLLVPYPETPGLDEYDFPLREWLDRMKGPAETDAAFLVHRVKVLRMSEVTREIFYQELGVPMRVKPGADTPARTRARYDPSPIIYRQTPPTRRRPVLPAEIHRPPRSVTDLPPREGRKIVDLAREAMVTRARDLDVFAYGDAGDVRLVDCGDGLQFAVFSAVPERRLLLEAVYGFLTLKNGVPIGYVLISALYGSSEIAFNVFETYRGAEAAHIYGRVLATVRHLFRVDAFTIYPYQLGHGNEEGLRSGAWWFYQKLGFRPRDPKVVRLMEQELAAMALDQSHRSSLATLRSLSEENVYLYLGSPREDIIGVLPLANIGLHVTRDLAARGGSEREGAVRACSGEAKVLLGVRSLRGFSAGEKLAWERWSPLVSLLPGVRRWNPADKAALVRVIRAKGGSRESEFVLLFDRHRALRRALRAMATSAIDRAVRQESPRIAPPFDRPIRGSEPR
jgi:hypothetical protein